MEDFLIVVEIQWKNQKYCLKVKLGSQKGFYLQSSGSTFNIVHFQLVQV